MRHDTQAGVLLQPRNLIYYPNPTPVHRRLFLHRGWQSY